MVKNWNRKQFSPPFCGKNNFLGFSRAIQCPLLWAQEVDIWASKFTYGAEHSGQSSRSQLKRNIPPSLGAQCMGANSTFGFCSKFSHRSTPWGVLWTTFRRDERAHFVIFFRFKFSRNSSNRRFSAKFRNFFLQKWAEVQLPKFYP